MRIKILLALSIATLVTVLFTTAMGTITVQIYGTEHGLKRLGFEIVSILNGTMDKRTIKEIREGK